MSRDASTGFSPRFVAPILLSTSLNPINTTMITVALAPIARDLGLRSGAVIWLVAALYLTSAVSQPTMGKLADYFGPKRVQLSGLVVVIAAGLVPTLSHTFAGAIVARVLLGVGTSAAYPSAMTQLRLQSIRLGVDTPPGLLSAVSISSLATAAVGPFLGGILIAVFGWPAIFLINVPLAGLSLLMAIRWLPADRTRPTTRPAGSVITAIDPIGLTLFAVSVTALLVFLLDLRSGLWWLAIGFGLAAVVLLAWERRQPRPFLDVRLLARNGPLSRTYLRLFLLYLSLYLIAFAISQWLQDVVGLSASAAGLAQLPYAVLAGAAAVCVGRTRRLRAPLIAAAALPLIAGGLLLVSSAHSPLWWLVVVVSMFGIPQGLASVSNQAALYRQAPVDATGAAAGLSRTSIYLGAIMSSSVVGLVFHTAPSDHGLHVMAAVIMIVCAAVLVLTVLDRALAAPPPAPAGELAPARAR